MTGPIFQLNPLVIVALHLPPFNRGKPVHWAYMEDYLLENLRIFSAGGVQAVMLQDETPVIGNAYPETIAMMASLGRSARREFPTLQFGIIIEAHDPISPLAVAYACEASFVRIKVFVGTMLKPSGMQQGCGLEAVAYRRKIDSEEISLLADVFDRTGYPQGNMPIAGAAKWAIQTGADGLILTGSDFSDSQELIQSIRKQNLGRPLLIGGGITIENVDVALTMADGIIVSRSLKVDHPEPKQIIQWDSRKVNQFMNIARTAVQKGENIN